MKRTLTIPGLALVCLCGGLHSASISPQEAARNIEKKLASLRSLQADFEQSYFSASLSMPLLEKGKLFLEKPDRMRWEYREPERNIYIYKEGVSLAYFPEDNQLFRHTLSAEEKNWAIFSLLTGRARLVETYAIEAAEFPTEKKTAIQLKLIPLEEGEISHILIETDPRTWLLERAVFLDWAGNKQAFRFSGFKLNPRLDAALFELEVPPDCEIIDDLPPEKSR